MKKKKLENLVPAAVVVLAAVADSSSRKERTVATVDWQLSVGVEEDAS